ncbi:hypothetical protein ACQJBY_073673 [Aegilops geniculata]
MPKIMWTAMKLTVFFSLLPLLTISLPCIAGNTIQLVYDTEGEPLNSYNAYYVLPAKHVDDKLFLTTKRIHHHGCLYHVALESNMTIRTNMEFTPLPPPPPPRDVNIVPIHLSSDVWIETNDLSSLCAKMLPWHLTGQSPNSSLGSTQYVAAGNKEGTWSPLVFRIERHGTDMTGYKLVVCANKGPCKDLGLHTYNGNMWLTMSNEPFMVVFMKAT